MQFSEKRCMKNNKKSRAYINLILKKGEPSALLRRCLCEDNVNTFSNIANQIKKREEFSYIKDSLFIKDYCLMDFSKGIGTSNTVLKTVAWFINVILSYSNEINKYIELKNKFEKYILCEQFDIAEEILNYVDSNICVSFWSLKNRLLINNLQKKMPQREYINSLNLSNYLEECAFIFSNMTDPNSDYYLYHKNITNLIAELDDRGKVYYKHLFGNNSAYNTKHLNYFLLNVSHNSIIDIYNVVVDMFRNDMLEAYSSFSKNLLIVLNNDIRDEIINSANALINEKEVDINNEIKELLLEFENNNYKVFIDNYFSNDNYDIITNFSIIRLVATALLIQSNDEYEKPDKYSNLLFSILIYMKELILSEDYNSFKISSDRLLNISKVLYGFSISEQIKKFVNYYITGKLEGNFLKSCYNRIDLYITEKIVDLEYPMLFPENILIVKMDYKSVYSFVEKIKEISKLHSLSKNRLMYEIARKKRDYDTAIKIFAEFIMSGNMIIYNMITKEFEEECEKSLLLKNKISEYELVFIFSNKYLEPKRKTVFRKFHRQNQMRKPLDILSKSFDSNFIVYFLRKISNRDMLNTLYGEFVDDDEVDNYRIEICKELCTLNEENKETYVKEISEISKGISLRMMRRDIDESKLSVDFDYIRDNVYNDFSSKLRLYFDTPQDKLEIADIYSPIAQRKLIIDNSTLACFVQSRNVIIEDMFRIYAQEFCFGNKGLDTFISTRIRHGPFEHEISGVFKEYNVINFNNNFYQKQVREGALKESAKTIIDELCNNIDKEVRLCIEQKFKVYIDNKIENAIFDYNMNSNDFDYITLHNDFDCSKTAYKFIDIFCDCIKEKTNNYLTEIQDVVLEVFLDKLSSLLNNFLNDIKNYCMNKKCYDAISNNVTHCKTDLQNKIEQIKKWFNLTEQPLNIDYSWNDLISITKKSFEDQVENFKTIDFIYEDNSKSVLRGDTFSNFYDIFEILINNAIQHSGFSNISDLKISIKIEETDNGFNVVILNSLSDCIDKNILNSVINDANEKFKNNNYENNTNKEGGMGLIKTMNILFSIMNLKGDFDIKLIDNCFKIQFIINKERVIIDNQ